MTFEEYWMDCTHSPNHYAEISVAYKAGAASRDAEIAGLKADAMRYRWIKTHGLQRAWLSLGTDCDGENFVYFKCEFKVPEPQNLPYEDDEGFEWADEDFDAAIDAALAKGEK